MDSRSQGDLSGSTDGSHRLSAHSLPVLPLYAPKNGTLKSDHQIEGDHAAKKGHVNDKFSIWVRNEAPNNSKKKIIIYWKLEGMLKFLLKSICRLWVALARFSHYVVTWAGSSVSNMLQCWAMNRLVRLWCISYENRPKKKCRLSLLTVTICQWAVCGSLWGIFCCRDSSSRYTSQWMEGVLLKNEKTLACR